MRTWHIYVSDDTVAQVRACSLGSAFWKLKRAGFTPLREFSGLII